MTILTEPCRRQGFDFELIAFKNVHLIAQALGAHDDLHELWRTSAVRETGMSYGILPGVARALHWAAWIGTPSTVELLIAHGADIEAKCSEFQATPLFWAVHGCGPNGPKKKKDQVGAARLLINAGAKVDTANRHGQSALEASKRCENGEIYELLQRSVY